jgi:hypothetical protein
MNKLPLFIILLLIGFCISPVSAVAGDIGYYEFQDQRVESTLIKHEIDKPQSSFVFSAPEGYAIVGADFLIPPDAGFNFSMYTDDYVISGWGDYQRAGYLNLTGTELHMVVGSNESHVSQWAPAFHRGIYFKMRQASQYVDVSKPNDGYDRLTELISLGVAMGADDNQHHDIPATSAYQDISPMEIFRTLEVNNFPAGQHVTVYLISEEFIQTHYIDGFVAGRVFGLQSSTSDDPLGDILSFFESLMGLLGSVFAVFVIIEYIFVEHFFEIVIFYEVILLAYSAANSRDIISFSKKFIKSNMALFDFFMRLVGILVEITTRIIQALKPI